MANVEEPAVEASRAHGLMRRLYSKDDSPLTQDELDSLMQHGGKDMNLSRRQPGRSVWQ